MMTQASGATSEPSARSDREIVLTRTFDAPAARVFKMWTEADHVARWWAPKGFTTTVKALDARPGGVFRLVMHGADGTDYPVKGVYREVVPPKRLVYVEDWDDDARPSMESLVTVAFEEHDGGTVLTLRILYASAADRAAATDMGVVEGWSSCFDNLADELAPA